METIKRYICYYDSILIATKNGKEYVLTARYQYPNYIMAHNEIECYTKIYQRIDNIRKQNGEVEHYSRNEKGQYIIPVWDWHLPDGLATSFWESVAVDSVKWYGINVKVRKNPKDYATASVEECQKDLTLEQYDELLSMLNIKNCMPRNAK